MDKLTAGSPFHPADILLPKAAELEKWSVVACDQYTSEPAYWARVAERVGSAPSALHLTLPEVYLEREDTGARIEAIHRAMADYCKGGVFSKLSHSYIYIERTLDDGGVRHGLLGMVDLDRYEFDPARRADVRATEGTVLSRIPPRIRVREGACVELPHTMLLVDDGEDEIITTARSLKGERLYACDLMERGGHIEGFAISGAAADALYAQLQGCLLLVGDGNHSLASAKGFWDELKETMGSEDSCRHPARFALCELVNIHDAALRFEPIHRVVFGVSTVDFMRGLVERLCMGDGEKVPVRVITGGRESELMLPLGASGLPIEPMQAYIDGYIAEKGGTVDYVHGDHAAAELAAAPDAVAFLLPTIQKSGLFRAVSEGGLLPRKAFSMGEAWDKRYYLEARTIDPEV